MKQNENCKRVINSKNFKYPELYNHKEVRCVYKTFSSQIQIIKSHTFFKETTTSQTKIFHQKK